MQDRQVYKFGEFEVINEMIRKRGSKWVVLNKDGSKVLGTHSSRNKAIKQLRAIEISKAMHESLRGNWERHDDLTKALTKCPYFDSIVRERVKAIDDLMESLENEFWYNRESRFIEHYALDMKMHVYPDLKRWSQETGKEEDEDSMENDWAKFMEETFEMEREDIKESYEWVEEVYAGGRSGGWLLIVPSANHEYISEITEEEVRQYSDEIEEIDEDQLSAFNEYIESGATLEQIKRLSTLGLIDFDPFGEIEKSVNYFLTQTEQLEQRKIDLDKIEARIEEFREKAEDYFYEWLADN